jgi:hypothetical protein
MAVKPYETGEIHIHRILQLDLSGKRGNQHKQATHNLNREKRCLTKPTPKLLVGGATPADFIGP